jgi:hypothetical protein
MPATATVGCKKCGRSAQVKVTGRGTVRTLGQTHSATQHGGGLRNARQNKGLMRRIFGG